MAILFLPGAPTAAMLMHLCHLPTDIYAPEHSTGLASYQPLEIDVANKAPFRVETVIKFIIVVSLYELDPIVMTVLFPSASLVCRKKTKKKSQDCQIISIKGTDAMISRASPRCLSSPLFSSEDMIIII